MNNCRCFKNKIKLLVEPFNDENRHRKLWNSNFTIGCICWELFEAYQNPYQCTKTQCTQAAHFCALLVLKDNSNVTGKKFTIKLLGNCKNIAKGY